MAGKRGASGELLQSVKQIWRYLGIALESEKIYNALPDEELQRYKKDFKFFQELRKSVKFVI